MQDLSFPDRLRDASDRLTDADSRAVRAILDDPRNAALLTVSELAARAGVHEATATRLAQKLGYKGFPALREALQQQYIASSDGVARVTRSLGRVAGGGFLADLVQAEMQALASLPEALPQALLDAAADRIMAARRIFLFAHGHALALSELAERRLRRFGRDVVLLSGESRTIAERLSLMQRGDLLLAFAFRTVPALLPAARDHAVGCGAETMLLADLSAAAALGPFGMTLAAPRGRSGDEFQTLTVPMAIMNALVLTIAGRHKTEAIGALERAADLIRRIDGST